MLCRPVARVCLVLVLAALCTRPLSAAEPGPVSIREETLTLPTYQAGPPDTNPMFYTARVVPGGPEARSIPTPLQDHLTHDREDKTYTALDLENEYVKLIGAAGDSAAGSSARPTRPTATTSSTAST